VETIGSTIVDTHEFFGSRTSMAVQDFGDSVVSASSAPSPAKVYLSANNLDIR